MKKYLLLSFVLFFCSIITNAQSVDDFKQAFVKKMLQLKPDEAARRTIKFGEVVPAGKPNGGYYPYKVTAYIHDYSAGYPANKYYGQTCVGTMNGWKFDLLKDDQGQWTVQGAMTVTSENKKCANNTAAGVESIPLESVPGTVYQPGKNTAAAPANAKSSPTLYIGEYASYGNGRLLIGLGFVLEQNGTYHNLDKKGTGTYVYNAQQGTISFKGGFMNGQTGKNVKTTGFDLSSTIHCEPWRP